MSSRNGPRRVVCLTEETTETLYLLGEDERIVGVSGYTRRPIEARRKAKVSAFISARIDKIVDLKPGLAIGFSNLQGKIAQDLIQAGVTKQVLGRFPIGGVFIGARRQSVQSASRRPVAVHKPCSVIFRSR